MIRSRDCRIGSASRIASRIPSPTLSAHGRAIADCGVRSGSFQRDQSFAGHGVGDWLLTEVARRIAAVASQSTATLARLDGDEFAVLIDNVAARLEAQTVAAAILAAFEEPMRVNGMEVGVRASIGVSVWPDDGRRSDDLLAHAEVAMTIAKERGGSQALFFQPGMTDSMQERLALEERSAARARSAGIRTLLPTRNLDQDGKNRGRGGIAALAASDQGDHRAELVHPACRRDRADRSRSANGRCAKHAVRRAPGSSTWASRFRWRSICRPRNFASRTFCR